MTTIHGKGTFVKQDKVEQELGALTSLTDVIKMHGYNPQVKVIRKEDRTTTATFSENEYDEKIDCMYIERVHIIEDETIALAQAYIPNTYGQSLSKTELEQNTIYELLEDKFKMTLGEADQSIEAVPADEYLSEVLKVDTGTPLLKAQRLVFNSSNEFVEKIIFYYRHDTFAFKVKLNSMSITPMWPTK